MLSGTPENAPKEKCALMDGLLLILWTILALDKEALLVDYAILFPTVFSIRL